MALANRVKRLDPATAEKIAAGEVIERPASAVKELVENSIDAGATQILVELVDGGKALIRVTDNGFGMNKDDLMLAVERHATSKISSIDDLLRIQSLGFRGEALPSLAAVAQLKILSRDATSTSSHAYTHTPSPKVSAETFGHYLGSVHGTQVSCENLFSLLPVRLKFLKSQAGEVSACREVIERIALCRPEISFELRSNEKTVLRLQSTTEENRVAQLLDVDTSLRHVEVNENGLKIRLHWAQGSSQGSQRKVLSSINGRYVRDRVIQQALLAPFKQSLLPGQSPALACLIQMDPAELDVNVHPTKTEVRFTDSSLVFRTVSKAIERLIESHGVYPAFEAHSFTSPSSSFSSEPSFQTPMFQAMEPSTIRIPQAREELDVDVPRLKLEAQQYVGVLMQTYLVFDQGHQVVLVDQHAAHERVRYEALKHRFQNGDGASQLLLLPETAGIPGELSQPNLLIEKLENLGFEVERFGEEKILVRAAPVEWLLAGSQGQFATRLQSLMEAIDRQADPKLWDESVFEKLAMTACRSSVRAGDRLEPIQATTLCSELLNTEHPWNCPHGRPTLITLAESKFAEWFQRLAPHTSPF